MRILINPKLPKQSPTDKIRKIVAESKIDVRLDGSRILVILDGPVASIPSLKNSKSPGANYTNKYTKARIEAMDALWPHTSKSRQGPLFKKPTKVHVLILNAKRSTNFDPIGCLETIQDWLEPSTKQVGQGKNKRSRGWGIGMIEDDSQVVGLSLRHDEFCSSYLDINQTYILIQPFIHVEPRQRIFINEIHNFY